MDSAQFVNLGGLIGLITYIIWQDWRNGRLIKGGTKEVNADNRNVMQSVLSQMEILTAHFNHDTTSLLTEIRDGQNEMRDCLKGTKAKLEEIQKYGVKLLKE
jgi:hypothetical protein